MSKRTLWLIAVPAALVAAACAPKADTAADEAAIKKINDNVVRWFQNKNADSLASTYAENAVDMNSNQPPSKGREAIRTSYAQLFAAPGAKLNIQPKATTVSGDLAVSDGSYTLSMTGPGGAPMDDSGNYVVVLKKTNGTWMVTEAIGTSEKPLPAPPAAPAKKKGK
jgi:uncharacterized protein (TIGR02246 family)